MIKKTLKPGIIYSENFTREVLVYMSHVKNDNSSLISLQISYVLSFLSYWANIIKYWIFETRV